jgi:hypothetical protein
MNWQDRDTTDLGLSNDRNTLAEELATASDSSLKTETAFLLLLRRKLLVDNELLISCLNSARTSHK